MKIDAEAAFCIHRYVIQSTLLLRSDASYLHAEDALMGLGFDMFKRQNNVPVFVSCLNRRPFGPPSLPLVLRSFYVGGKKENLVLGSLKSGEGYRTIIPAAFHDTQYSFQTPRPTVARIY